MLNVKVIPRPEYELPIEILSIIPSSVLLVEGENSTQDAPPSEALSEEVDVKAVQNTKPPEVDTSPPVIESEIKKIERDKK